MELATASAVMNYAEKLEMNSAAYYEAAAARFDQAGDSLRKFVKENEKNVKSNKRAYYSVISDALETSFSFESLTTEPYEIEPVLVQDGDLSATLKACIEAEGKIQEFYKVAAKKSEPFMADVPAAFRGTARVHTKRKAALEEMLAAL